MIGGFNIFGYGYGYSDYQNGNTPSLDPLSRDSQSNIDDPIKGASKKAEYY